jgi:hypothetical protein
MHEILALLMFLRALLCRQLRLATENLALRQQLATLHRSVPRPRLHDHDRRFWILLARLWPGWRSALLIVAPATVVRWHPPRKPELRTLARQNSLKTLSDSLGSGLKGWGAVRGYGLAAGRRCIEIM